MSLQTRSNILKNQENANSRFGAKHTSIAPNKMVLKRPVLGEMGNRLQAIPKHFSVKKNGAFPDPKENRCKTGKTLTQTDRLQQAMPPPCVPVKKDTTVSGISKEDRKASGRIVSISARPGIRRQENNPKPVSVSEMKAVTKPEKILNIAARSAIGSRGVATKDIVVKRKPTSAVDKNSASASKTGLDRQKRTENVTSQAIDVVSSSRKLINVTARRGIKKPEIDPEHSETASSDGVSSPENHAATDIDSELEAQEIALRNIALCDSKAASEQPSCSSSRLEFSDPDEDCKEDPMMVAEYAFDIFHYLRSLEEKFAIQKDFLKGQVITPKMRMILVDWLVGVHDSFGLLLETLYLCVSIVDRYMQENKEVIADYFQLVGVAALLVAVKYEETYIPSLQDFEYICANTFSRRKILAMERNILKKLGFNLGRPLPLQFLRRYNKLAGAKTVHHALGKYILELSLMKYDLCHVRPSLQAAAACCLSIGVLNEVEDLSTVWTPALAHHSGYEYSQLKEVVVIMADLLVKSESSRFQTTRKKYASTKNSSISTCSLFNGPLMKKLLEGKARTTTE